MVLLNSKKILIVAPHADDETLGAGGLLIRAKKMGIKIYWLLITSPNKNIFSREYINKHEIQIKKVKKFYGFSGLHKLHYPSADLEQISKAEIINSIQEGIKKYEPDTIILPHIADAHSDHYITHVCCMAACKIFKLNSMGLKKIYSMEVLSETDIFTSKKDYQFQPNTWVDISNSLNDKIRAFKFYKTEIQKDGPRSPERIKNQAKYNGVPLGWKAAERFCLLNSIED